MKVSLVALAILSAILFWFSDPGDEASLSLSDGVSAETETYRAQLRAEEERRRVALIHASVPEREALVTLCLERLQELMVTQARPVWTVIGVVAPAASSEESLASRNFRRIRLDGEHPDIFIRAVAERAFALSAEDIQPPGIQFLVHEERAVPGFTTSPRFIVGYHCRFMDIGQVFLSRGVTISAT